MAGPTLPLPFQTERLTLRWYQPDDFAGLYALQSDPDLLAYVPFGIRSEQEVTEHLDWRLNNRILADGDDRLGIAVTKKHDDGYVGDLVLFFASVDYQCGEIGYMLLPEYQGNGYMTEAVAALIGLGFDSIGLRRIVAHIDARNTSSAAVAERVGMRLEAHHLEDELFKGEWTDSLIYAVLRSEWEQRP